MMHLKVSEEVDHFPYDLPDVGGSCHSFFICYSYFILNKCSLKTELNEVIAHFI